MARNLKDLLARKLAENSQRHAQALQEVQVDLGRTHSKLPVQSIDPNPYQPRRIFPQAELESLASSISQTGLLQPIIVRSTGERYQIVAGERRWRAHKLLGRPTIEAIITGAEDSEMALFALAENIDRQDLSDYEIGQALRRIEQLFPTKTRLAEALGLNREDMYRYFSFEALPPFIQERLDASPRLLSRAAATDLKRLLQQNPPLPRLDSLLREAWERLEAGELDQTKLSAWIQRAASRQAERDGAVREPLEQAGRRVGSITLDARSLTLRLKRGALSERQEEALRRFVEKLLGAQV